MAMMPRGGMGVGTNVLNLLTILILSLSIVPFFHSIDERQPKGLQKPQKSAPTRSPPIHHPRRRENTSASAVLDFKRSSDDKSTSSLGMGACMLVKDDNPLLYEWISYHYTVLPLRYFLIASDEGSETDPSDVLDRWNQTELNYRVWTANDFVPGIRYKYGDHVYRFMKRQGRFYKRCLKFMKDQNLTWVALVDSDEYIRWNPYDAHKERSLKPDQLSDANYLRYFRLGQNDSFDSRLQARKWMAQTPHNQKTILYALQNIPFTTSPCHTMRRLQYTAMTEQGQCEWPPLPSSQTFLYTRQFIHHIGKRNPENHWGKVLVDVSRVDRKQMNEAEGFANPHGPLGSCLRPPALHAEASLFIVNHYLGPWERYAARDGDNRRNVDNWIRYANQTKGQDCDTGTWVDSFWKLFHPKTAKYLLGLDNGTFEWRS